MQNDLISRSKLLKSPIRITGTLGGKYPFETISVAEIENAPAVDAVPVVHGWWKGLDYTWECNKCHAQINRRLFSCNMHYCPNCGARMDGKEANQ